MSASGPPATPTPPPGVKPGDTFILDPEGGTNSHIWVVLAVDRPDMCEDWAIIVSITSVKPETRKFADLTCVVDVGDHPFLTHESYVYYGDIQEVEVRRLLGGLGARRQPCSADFLKRLREGVHASPRTKKRFKSRVPRS